MNLDKDFNSEKLICLVGIHLVFVVSALLLAVSDRIASGRSDNAH